MANLFNLTDEELDELFNDPEGYGEYYHLPVCEETAD